jgi:hypothetical protein
MKTLIFVSHSSADNALTDAFCKQLEGLLGGQANYQILVDTQTLETGGIWPVQLHEMMAGCHAAVVLLSDSALKSRWVLKELTILSWRKSLEPQFNLFIAQFPGITDDQVEQSGYAPLEFRRIQGINSNDPALIAARVHAGLQANAIAPATTLFDRLAKKLGELLRQADAQSLKDLAQDLKAEWPAWRPQTDPTTALVESICRQILRGDLGSFPGLAELFESLKTKLPPHALEDVLKLAAPHWVDRQAAGQFGNLIDRRKPQPQCGIAAINGNHAKLYTGKMYLGRAFPLGSEYRLHAPNRPPHGDVLAYYTAAICDAYKATDEDYAGLKEDEIVARLKTEPPWLFVVIEPLDHRGLKELREKFPTVCFLIDVGAQDYDKAALPEGVTRLLPPVDTAIEDKQHNDYRRARRIMKGTGT